MNIEARLLATGMFTKEAAAEASDLAGALQRQIDSRPLPQTIDHFVASSASHAERRNRAATVRALEYMNCREKPLGPR